MGTPVDVLPTFRDSFEELLPPAVEENSNHARPAERCVLLVDCSGSTHNLFVESQKGFITIFDLLGSFASSVAEETARMDLVPFASTFKGYRVETREQVQNLYTHATEQGLFNHLGEGTNLYDPLQQIFDDFVEKAQKTAKSGGARLQRRVIVATDGVPTGGMDALMEMHELCSEAFVKLEELGYTDKDFNVSFVTVRPDAISDAWHEERGQTVQQWQENADEMEAYYATLGRRLRADKRIQHDFVSHCTLVDMAKAGVRSFLAQQ